MPQRIIAITFGVILAVSVPAVAATLAENGEATAAIVLCDSPTKAEQTAAKELAHYLSQVTGGAFSVTPESNAPKAKTCVYVGPTSFAKNHGLDASGLGSEEWIMRTVGDHLVLAGGRPRGTLYAVYHFLEDVVGVHWWNPFEESVPSKPNIEIEGLDRKGKPVIRYRDIYMLYGHDGGRFAARNRLNRDGDAGISAAYGGEMDYGPPYHVHTFYKYIPPKTYLETHPEWFSLIDGKRTTERAQLCLTNQELRRVFVEKLKANIKETRAEAAKDGRPAPVVFSISQNDWGGWCQCAGCRAIAQAEGSEAGPLLDFVNYIADAIKDEYPDIYIDTLAYQMTQDVPKTIKARDNVIVRLCDTLSNYTKPITDPDNQQFREEVLSWAKIAKNLRIWDYGITYGPYSGMPMPTVHTYPTDYQFYAEHSVEGVFTEHELPILADMRDLKVWMMIKMLEDPYRDYGALVREFTDGFYGKAGKLIREYLDKLEAASAAKSNYLSMSTSPSKYRYLDLAFVQDAMTTFDEAEQAVGGDAILLRRVRYARLPLDRATVVLFPKLAQQWVQAGNDADTMPLEREAIAARYKEAWRTQINLCIPENLRAPEHAKADYEIRYLLRLPSNVPMPKKFHNLPRDAVFQYTATETRNWKDVVKCVPDAESESGVTNRIELSDEDMKKYKLPMPWGLYNVADKDFVHASVIKHKDVPGQGFHWYKMGTLPIGSSYYLYFFWSWYIQVDVGNVVDPKHPDQEFDVWACIKFEGPGFPHGNPGDQNAICVERVVLVKTRYEAGSRREEK